MVTKIQDLSFADLVALTKYNEQKIVDDYKASKDDPDFAKEHLESMRESSWRFSTLSIELNARLDILFMEKG